MKALIVDDSRAMRKILGSVVADMGFEVAEAGSLGEALNRLADGGGADVLLIDWNLPDGDGVELVRRVRSRPDQEGTLILMVTSETSRERMTEALEAGANEYVTKPFSRDTLLAKLGLLGIIRA